MIDRGQNTDIVTVEHPHQFTADQLEVAYKRYWQRRV